ncbi:hypothetical protein [Paenibacillus polymyxa]|uniref:hypothetical protein n=1 Tax=Paenibacillus polymyxa TaxID=1406 RepID=UPI00287FAC07|nr:hypothetical protein [Paenibacillus polymyxa]
MGAHKLLEESFTTRENEGIRNKYINRVEILDKVKALVLLPNKKHVTAKMIADYYEVDKNVVEQIIKRQREEFVSDGMLLLRGQEAVDFNTDNNSVLTIPRKMINVFTRRSVLRVGMLLRDSNVAIEVRNYLLNMDEAASEQERVVVGGWTDADVLTLNKIMNEERGKGSSKMEAVRVAAKAIKKNPHAVYQKYRNVTKKHGSLENYITTNNLVYFNKKSEEIHQVESQEDNHSGDTLKNNFAEVTRILESLNTTKELESKINQLKLEMRDMKHKLEIKDLELEAETTEVVKKDKIISKLKKDKLALEASIKAIRKIVLNGAKASNNEETGITEAKTVGHTYTRDKGGMIELKN